MVDKRPNTYLCFQHSWKLILLNYNNNAIIDIRSRQCDKLRNYYEETEYPKSAYPTTAQDECPM